MKQIEAKSIVQDRYWILHKDNKKVGQVVEIPNGLEVNINGVPVTQFKDLEEFKQDERFTFTEIKDNDIEETNHVYGYDTDGLAYNPLWNLQYKLPIYTQEQESKSWYCAGYYLVDIKGTETIEFCPKLITLQRNSFKGPFADRPQIPKETLFASH